MFTYILPWNWKIRVTFAMVAPKFIFKFNFFVALCASNIVPSKVFFNILCCCKACEYSFLQLKKKKTFLLSLMKAKYIIGVMFFKKNVEYLIIWFSFQGYYLLDFPTIFVIFFQAVFRPSIVEEFLQFEYFPHFFHDRRLKLKCS